MPTTRPRHLVTESDELAVALDIAAAQRPGLSRSQVLVQLALAGHRAAQLEDQARRARRLAALERLSGSMTGMYGPGYLERLREDWPE